MKTVKKYEINAHGVEVRISIVKKKGKHAMTYRLELPDIGPATQAVLDGVKEKVIQQVKLSEEEVINERVIKKVNERIKEETRKVLKDSFPKASSERINNLLGVILVETIGLGPLEYLLNDPELEEVVAHGHGDPAWVYHRELGWLKTNVALTDEQVYNYATIIGRRAGRSITSLDPLLDARLLNGDRVHATLYPISYFGNTITIRKFRRKPWTITNLINNNTLSINEAALLWLATQYELSYLISGGTASGKTTLLNTLLAFMPGNHRVISIEDTKELQLPSFLYWTSLVVREPNPEGKGGVSMQELMINSLRMRPDRIVVGEVRRKFQAETLFEAVHTGHSVYATVHAETGDQTIKRLTNEPISVPKSMVSSVPLIIVMFRDRRKGIRRVSEICEVVPTQLMGEEKVELNHVWEWDSSSDEHYSPNESKIIMDKITRYTGMSRSEVSKDLREKRKVLQWMIDKGVDDLESVGRVINTYYSCPEELLELVSKGLSEEEVFNQI